MTIPVIGAHTALSSNFATSLTTGSVTSQATGSRFFIGVFGKKGVVKCSDSFSNNYVALTGQTFNGTFGFSTIFECISGVGGSGHTFTGTLTGGDTMAVWGVEVTGSGPSTSQILSVHTTGTNPTSPTLTTTQANMLILVFICGTGPGAPTSDNGAGFAFIDTLSTFLPGGNSSASGATIGSYTDNYSYATSADTAAYTIAIPSPAGSFSLIGQGCT